VHVIGSSNGKKVAGLLSDSEVPDLPDGYTVYRWIGSALGNNSGALLESLQVGDGRWVRVDYHVWHSGAPTHLLSGAIPTSWTTYYPLVSSRATHFISYAFGWANPTAGHFYWTLYGTNYGWIADIPYLQTVGDQIRQALPLTPAQSGQARATVSGTTMYWDCEGYWEYR
jgi:hypothetical protein